VSQIYNLHTPFVIAFLVFVVVFVLAHLGPGPGSQGGAGRR
jgi:hypothetical protein